MTTRILTCLPMRQVALLAIVFVSLFALFSFFGGDTSAYSLGHSKPPATVNEPPVSEHPKPDTTHSTPEASTPEHVPTDSGKGKVIGLVFFGRRELVEVLDCYLKRNLKANGGLLDEVVFALNTDNKEDLAYLEDELLPSSPHYRKFKAPERKGWVGQWQAVDQRDAIYIKMDDDVVFFEDDAIANVVKTMRENPDYFAASANVVNNPALSWVHYHLGVHEPYWPEMTAPSSPPAKSWRASELPAYNGPVTGPKGWKSDGSVASPFVGHRWLPVRGKQEITGEEPVFPASTVTYDAFGPGLRNWGAAAQLQYSFLQHLENGEIWKFKFGVWDYHYDRVSINFFAIRGGDIMDAYPFPKEDDEGYLTVDRPKELHRHVVVVGDAIAVHFAFGPQRWAHDGHGLAETDLLSRYSAYAEEMVCPHPTRSGSSLGSSRHPSGGSHSGSSNHSTRRRKTA